MNGPIGYVYQAAIYCPTCIVDAATLYPSVGGLDPRDTEHRLDFCAGELGINREDEGSFDSDDFPKVYVGTPHDGCTAGNGYEPGQCGDTCETCHEPLDGECPNTAVPQDYLTAMVDGYIVAALRSTYTGGGGSNGDAGEPMSAWNDASDLAPTARDSIESDCRDFATDNWADLKDMDPVQAGHDFLLTRDRHGAGFWDRGLGDKGDRLTAAAHVWGESGLYVGDSGDIHTTNENTRCTDCGCSR